MKNITLLIFILGFIQIGFSQPKHKKEQIKALKTAHITNALNLSSSEAEKFWPVYNASQEKEHANRRTMRKLRQQVSKDISEQEAQKLLNQFLKLADESYRIRTDLIKQLREVLPAKKIIALKKAEDDFNRKLLKEFRERRRPSGTKGSY